eukprot:UN32816
MSVRGLNWAGNFRFFQAATLIVDYMTYGILIFMTDYLYMVKFPDGGPKNLIAVVIAMVIYVGILGLREQIYYLMLGDYVSPAKRSGLTKLNWYYLFKTNGGIIFNVWALAQMDMLYWETPTFEIEYIAKTYSWVYLLI